MDIVNYLLTKAAYFEKIDQKKSEMYMRIATKCDECLSLVDEKEKNRVLVIKAFERVRFYAEDGDEKKSEEFIKLAKKAADMIKKQRLKL